MTKKNQNMIGCIIQARMGSSRLPGKTLIKLDESRSTLDFVVNQLTFSTLINKTVIATTNLEQDDIIEKNAKGYFLVKDQNGLGHMIEKFAKDISDQVSLNIKLNHHD